MYYTNIKRREMADVFDVAKYILDQCECDITTFKLQKLVYYSQAWSLVWDDKPLFENKIYAWANGPACHDLYNYHQGLFSINTAHFNRGNPAVLTQDEIDTIDLVYRSYGHLSGQQLSNLTHTETPWINARKGLGLGERGNKEISLDSMVEYYSGIYAEQIKKHATSQATH